MTVGLRTGPFADTKYGKRYPWVGSCDVRGCYYFIAGRTLSEVDGLVQPSGHRCPLKGPTRIKMTVTTESEKTKDELEAEQSEYKRPKNAYEKIWDELDETVSILLDPAVDAEKKAIERRYAQGLAFALAAIGQYQLYTVDQINKEARERWKMRTGQIPWRPTQGYTWDCVPDTPAWEHPNNITGPGDERLAIDRAEARRRAAREAADARDSAERATPVTPRASARAQRGERTTSGRRIFSEKEVTAIKGARALDFGDEQLAKMYKCTVEEIKAVG